MATYQELVEELRDDNGLSGSEIDDAAALNLCRRAVRDIINRGALIDIEETEITLAASTWEYEVPAGFVYIHHLAYEDDSSGVSTYDEWVPSLHWTTISHTSKSWIQFHRDHFDLRIAGDKVRVFGQARPAVPTVLSGTVDVELEGLIQAAVEVRFLARLSQMGVQQAAGQGIDRANQRREARVMFDEALSHVDFRVRPSSRRVRGR